MLLPYIVLADVHCITQCCNKLTPELLLALALRLCVKLALSELLRITLLAPDMLVSAGAIASPALALRPDDDSAAESTICQPSFVLLLPTVLALLSTAAMTFARGGDLAVTLAICSVSASVLRSVLCCAVL